MARNECIRCRSTSPRTRSNGAGLAGAGVSVNQTRLTTLLSKVDAGGGVFLAGCSVGQGAEGASLLTVLGLIAQRSIEIVASRRAVAWRREGTAAKTRGCG